MGVCYCVQNLIYLNIDYRALYDVELLQDTILFSTKTNNPKCHVWNQGDHLDQWLLICGLFNFANDEIYSHLLAFLNTRITNAVFLLLSWQRKGSIYEKSWY